jgi:hypothetical protein
LLLLQANQGDAALDQIGRAFESQRRFARRVRDMGNSADAGGLDAIQAGDGARWNVQVTTGAARLRHHLGMLQECADADDHQIFAGGKSLLG